VPRGPKRKKLWRRGGWSNREYTTPKKPRRLQSTWLIVYDFNGSAYSLADATLVNVNGWQVAAFSLPSSALNLGANATNQLAFDLDTTKEVDLEFHGTPVW
jgi:hypothetical protein